MRKFIGILMVAGLISYGGEKVESYQNDSPGAAVHPAIDSSTLRNDSGKTQPADSPNADYGNMKND